MKKQNWVSLNLLDVNGMATNPVVAGNRYAKRLLNVVTNKRDGAISLRNGYTLLYDKPTNVLINNSEFLTFEVFNDTSIIDSGKEIVCLIQKGEMTSPVVDYNLKGFWFWIRPYWNGAEYVNDWQLLNETIIARIREVDNNYNYRIFVDWTEGIPDDKLVGWTVFRPKYTNDPDNYDKGKYSVVFANKMSSNGAWLYLTEETPELQTGEILIISRNWLDIKLMKELYDNVKQEDIVFHRVNNDLRIGFGGKENRDFLMLGYRKNYIPLMGIDYTNKHPVINDEGNLSLFAKSDGYIIEQAIPQIDSAGITITTVPNNSGNFTGKQYFRMTCVIDNYLEFLVHQTNIDLGNTPKDLYLIPYLELTKNTKRVLKTRIYHSSDSITYYLVREDTFRTNLQNQKYLQIYNNRLQEESIILYSDTHSIYKNRDAANGVDTYEAESKINWIQAYYYEQPDNSPNISVVTSAIGNLGDLQPAHGYFIIRYELGPYIIDPSKTIIFPRITRGKKKISIEFSLYIYPIPMSDIYIKLMTNIGPYEHGSSNYSFEYIIYPAGKSDWLNISINDFLCEGYLLLNFSSIVPSQQTYIYIDNIKVKYHGNFSSNRGEEMFNVMGYNPTFNYVKAYDDVAVKSGRVYYLNPYIDKRYENFILVSLINASSFLWDIATFENFRELDIRDNNVAVAVELLNNSELLILKNASLISLADDGIVGFLRPPVYGVSCASRNSIVSINGLIYWCGYDDVYILNPASSIIPIKATEKTIKDIYLGLANKNKIQGIRGNNNSYKIRIFNKFTKQELVLTDKGWVEEKKYHFVDTYRNNSKNQVYFMSSGNIYVENVDYIESVEVYGE